MSTRPRLRKLAYALPFAVMAPLLVGTVAAGPAAAHGSVTDPPTRNFGCLDRWRDNHLAPEMQQVDPMCYGAYQADPSAMWNWNGLYRDNVGGRHEQVIPDGTLCSGGNTEGGRYDYMDTPGPWIAKDVPHNFTLTLTDDASHGADYLRIYVSKPGFDPTTQSLGWGDLDLVTETGRFAPARILQTDVSLPTNRTGRAVLYTIWQASHMDQPYYLCSDINIGGTGGGTPTPEPTDPPAPEPTDPPAPEPTDPPAPEPTQPPVSGACSATVEVTNSWGGGYQGEIRVTAGSSAISGWSVTVDGADISQAWNGSISGNTISSLDWNGNLAASGSTTIGFIGSGSPGNVTATCTAS
ncbi:lytic polysaccharide monooxygenase [Cellulomonas bogoriensis]|uniref:Cellulose-binding protein n=1 Tax=Cellulomonas bogoriensis 69B4 = DSM 16987 TaxID=1386082 RepID=A0A0A0BYD3_9CELL|nr:lytic polysaccharide monooxygenase [Cellulomonas bogoriensis]KGM12936.1 cellulose-binding protein [Cellulomonas bogoriensis 69B4 = DSM 16987]